MGESLQRRERLRRRSDFLEVQARGFKAQGRHVIMIVSLPRPKESARSPMSPSSPSLVVGRSDPSTRPARLGITVTRKVGVAAVRNRIKRRVREIFRRHKQWFPVDRDIVVVARASAATADYGTLLRDLKRLCGRFVRSS